MYLGIDIGATKTLVAQLDENGAIVQQAKVDTPDEYPALISAISETVRSFGDTTYSHAAAGVPGVIDRTTGTAVSYGNRSWTNTPVGSDLSKLLGCPVIIENDGKVGGLVEAEYIKNDYSKVLYLAIGTGIGIAYIKDGINDLSVDDQGGHGLIVEFQGKTMPWEDFAGGQAIVKQFGKRAADIDSKSDWELIARNLSIGILRLLQDYDPEVIVFGGGVGVHFDKFKTPLAEALKEAGITELPALAQAHDPEKAVVYGCYLLIKQAL